VFEGGIVWEEDFEKWGKEAVYSLAPFLVAVGLSGSG
jgi:hypothetical protein